MAAMPALTNPPAQSSIQPQGDEARGRPLLARALAIQEVELGPSHPDVLAIRDVLDEGL